MNNLSISPRLVSYLNIKSQICSLHIYASNSQNRPVIDATKRGVSPSANPYREVGVQKKNVQHLSKQKKGNDDLLHWRQKLHNVQSRITSFRVPPRQSQSHTLIQYRHVQCGAQCGPSTSTVRFQRSTATRCGTQQGLEYWHE